MNIPPVISSAPANVPPPKRHGCLMVWLILMLIGDGIGIVMSALAPVFSGMLKGLTKAAGSAPSALVATTNAPPPPNWFLAATVILCLVDVAAIAGIFYWKRWGFYVSVVASGILFVLNIVNGTGMINSLLYLISPVLLYVTLRLGGENCGWRRLQ